MKYSKAAVARMAKEALEYLEAGGNENIGRAMGKLETLIEMAKKKPFGVGRPYKPVNLEEVVKLIDMGMGYRATAEKLNISVGLAHKLYHQERPTFKNQNNERSEEQITLV